MQENKSIMRKAKKAKNRKRVRVLTEAPRENTEVVL